MTLSLAWQILYYSWFISEVLIVIVTHTPRGKGKLSDRGSMLVLWVTITASITATGFIKGMLPSNMLMGAHWLKAVAVSILAIGLAIRWTAIITLGRSFSVNVAVHEDQHVLRTGLFRLVRHPSYLGMMIIFLAIGLSSRNWYGLLIMLLFPFAALLYRIHVEERALTDAFGEEYIDYSRSTRRLVPFIY